MFSYLLLNVSVGLIYISREVKNSTVLPTCGMAFHMAVADNAFDDD